MKVRAREQWNWRNFFICLGVSSGQIAFSYPASIIGTTLAQPSFLAYMNLLDEDGLWSSQAQSLIGAMSGVFQAGGIFGIFAVGYVMERWGRKAGMIFCSVLGLVGGALVCAAQNVTMFIAFKFLAGMSAWGFVCVSKLSSANSIQV